MIQLLVQFRLAGKHVAKFSIKGENHNITNVVHKMPINAKLLMRQVSFTPPIRHNLLFYGCRNEEEMW